MIPLGIAASGRRPLGYAAAVLADSPLAWWRMDDATIAPGATMLDSSGAARSGQYGSPASAIAGLVSGGTSLQGLASTAYASWMVVSAVTAECWLRTDTAGTFGIVGRTNAGTWGAPDTNLWRLYMSGGTVYWQVFTTGWTPGLALTAAGINTGTTHHIVGTWDGGTGRLIVDGSEVASTTATFTVAATTALPIDIGHMRGILGAPTGTAIDEVAVYGTALTLTRVAAHYTAGVA